MSKTDEKLESCEHYLRKCTLVSPCCNKLYACRFCHDEKENHKLIRSDVKQVVCLQCGCKQAVSPNCQNCLIIFGKYFCATCCLFDDRDKGQFHCDGCGICRVGGKDNFFHCNKCDVCLSTKIKDSHNCVEKSSRSNCAICLEDLHTSTIAATVPDCGHLLHSTCFKDLIRSGGYTCPTCNRCLVDMTSTWRKLDAEIAVTPMPTEYANFEVRVLCRDCHKHSKAKFHIIGLKCGECGSYNTSRDDDGNDPWNPPAFLADNNPGEDDIELELEDSDELEELLDDEERDSDSETEGDEPSEVTEQTDNFDDDNSVASDLSLD